MRLPPLVRNLVCWTVFSGLTAVAAVTPANSNPSEEKKGPLGFVKRAVSTTAEGVQQVGKKAVSGVFGAVSKVSKALGFPDAKKKNAGARVKLQVTPSVVHLDKNRTIEVLVKVTNPGKRAVLLEFNSSQRADAVVRDDSGNIVSRATEDQQFIEEVSVVSVNPGERVEYPLVLPTRELKAGRRYRLEAAIVNQENLRATETLEVK
jgi:hypothetical protein